MLLRHFVTCSSMMCSVLLFTTTMREVSLALFLFQIYPKSVLVLVRPALQVELSLLPDACRVCESLNLHGPAISTLKGSKKSTLVTFQPTICAPNLSLEQALQVMASPRRLVGVQWFAFRGPYLACVIARMMRMPGFNTSLPQC
jgi:hypothetical protein